MTLIQKTSLKELFLFIITPGSILIEHVYIFLQLSAIIA